MLLFHSRIAVHYRLKIIAEQRELYHNHHHTVKSCYFEIKGEQIHFGLREKLRQVEHKPTSDGEYDGGRLSYEPSGKLEFIVSCAHSCKYSWKDADVNGGVKVSHLAEQKCTTHSLYSRDRPGCQYSILTSSFLLPG